MKVALLQTNLVWEDSEENLSQLDASINELSEKVDLIVLPEMFNTGFTMNAEKIAEKMDGKAVEWLISKSIEQSAAICGSIIINEDARYYNRFIWAAEGKVEAKYDKRHLFRMADEHHYFTAGKERPVINYQDWQIMPRVCYDLRFPVWSRSTDIDLQIYVANWPAPRITAWDKLLMARAIENQCYVIGVNRIGNDGTGKFYPGHSVVVDPKGVPITSQEESSKGWIYAELDKASLDDYRAKFPLALDADTYSIDF